MIPTWLDCWCCWLLDPVVLAVVWMTVPVTWPDDPMLPGLVLPWLDITTTDTRSDTLPMVLLLIQLVLLLMQLVLLLIQLLLLLFNVVCPLVLPDCCWLIPCCCCFPPVVVPFPLVSFIAPLTLLLPDSIVRIMGNTFSFFSSLFPFFFLPLPLSCWKNVRQWWLGEGGRERMSGWWWSV